MKYFEKVGFTGSWYADGTMEVGYRCGHKHRTLRAARECKSRTNYGHGGEIREYNENPGYVQAYPLTEW